MRRGRDRNTNGDTVLEFAHNFLDLRTELLDDLLVAAQANLVVRLFTLAREAHEASLRLGLRWPAATHNELLETRSTRADERAVEARFDGQSDGDLVRRLLSNGQDGLFRRRKCRLRTTKRDGNSTRCLFALVQVDDRTRLVLDVVDRGTRLPEDARDSLARDGELGRVVVLLLKFNRLGE